ncbi:amidophosphoribosyltransferase [Emcibacter sp. SYSU 3D8]|uniref:amidophosphoribosyltransferase n=1 Tax=Emcibacter sp. SYSU 3D8 TaxID=3133969 RepID=UPI0031FE8AFB
MTVSTNPFDDDKLHEECGVFGIYGHPDSAALTVLGLHALQHRGQEAAGVVSYDGKQFHSERALGLVGDTLSSESVIASLPGDSAIGHNRYSTSGGTVLRNVQPLFAELSGGGFAIAHNGNITNAMTLRRMLVSKGAIFQASSDTEVIIHLVALSQQPRLVDRVVDALRQIEGAYSLVMLTQKKMIGIRDPLGIRPLVLGEMEGGVPVLASESVAFDIIGAKYVREIEPGEMIVFTENGIQSLHPFPKQKARPCIFENIYFSRPDTLTRTGSVYEIRKRIGAELSREMPVDADLVIPVPDSGTPSALGYSQESGIPFELGIIRNHYVGRTFIEPTDSIRHLGVRLKHNANKAQIAGQRVILVDDSIVRGTTSIKIVEMIRSAGAREVHMRIASPPTTHSCFYGVDTPERHKLLAARMTHEEMARLIGVDSLAFLSMDGLYRAVGETGRNEVQPQYCDACFSGDYPIRLVDHDGGQQSQLSLLAEA